MRIRRGIFLPNLCTLGNGICGFAAITHVARIGISGSPGALAFDQPEFFSTSAWLILAGMVFDVFDGRLARLTGRTSDLGAQLDSLCDLTTFGLAPAFMVVRMSLVRGDFWSKLAWICCLAYFVGAIMRLARFNSENDHDESAHLCFKGLPSPAAAGCVATLVIFHRYLLDFKEKELGWLQKFFGDGFVSSIQDAAGWIPLGIPFLMLVLGYTMVSSKLKYDHLASRLFKRIRSVEYFAFIVFCAILAYLAPEVVLPACFIGYLLSAPTLALVHQLQRLRGRSSAEAPERPPGGAAPRVTPP